MSKLTNEFKALGLEEQKSALDELQGIYDQSVEAKRAELMAQLEALGGAPKRATKPSGSRASPEPKYRTPDGSVEWSGRGGIPKAFKELGVTDKEGMKPYLIDKSAA